MRFIGSLLAPWIFGPFFVVVAIALMSEFNNLFRDSSLADNELKVLYLYDPRTDTGQRICEGGYDFRVPKCVYVMRDEWARKKHRMKWAVMDKNTNEFIRYDGWYVEPTEIDEDLLKLANLIGEHGDKLHKSVIMWYWYTAGVAGGAMNPAKKWDDIDGEDWDYINSLVGEAILELGDYNASK